MLGSYLTAEIFAFFLIFARLGAALMYMPTFGESFVPMRSRLAIGLLLTLIVAPVIKPNLPAIPENPVMLGLLVIGEVSIGLFLGLLTRAVFSALSVAGTVIATLSGLASALTNDLTAAQQGSIVASLLSTLGLLLIIISGLHHLLLTGIVNSYELFTPGQPPPVGEFAEIMAKTASKSFEIGFQLASPFIALTLVFYVGLGLISRLMPAMQVFFIALPFNILLALFLLFAALPPMLFWFLSKFEENILPIAGF